MSGCLLHFTSFYSNGLTLSLEESSMIFDSHLAYFLRMDKLAISFCLSESTYLVLYLCKGFKMIAWNDLSFLKLRGCDRRITRSIQTSTRGPASVLGQARERTLLMNIVLEPDHVDIRSNFFSPLVYLCAIRYW